MLRAALLLLLAGAAHAQTVVLYSRHDAEQARRAYALAALYEPPWIDRDLPPGVAWRPAIAAQICSARRVLVIWSARAAASAELAAELATADGCGAPLVPLLLDATPLPPLLAPIQAVDWR